MWSARPYALVQLGKQQAAAVAISAQETEENGIHVQVEFEKIVDKSKASIKDLGKKKRK